jgi:hypothetical protein
MTLKGIVFLLGAAFELHIGLTAEGCGQVGEKWISIVLGRVGNDAHLCGKIELHTVLKRGYNRCSL